MKKLHSPEQNVSKLRQAYVYLGKGLKVLEVCPQLDVSEQEYYVNVGLKPWRPAGGPTVGLKT